MGHIAKLQDQIDTKSARVGIIGLGYVGLPLMRAYWSADFHVIGFDVDREKINALKSGGNYLKHLGEDYVGVMSDSDRFDVTTDFGRLREVDAILVCVPTPLGRHLDPDLSYVERTSDAIATTLRPGQLIVLESTTYPGTTRDIMLPRLEQAGLRCGQEFFLAYSPEREDPGRKDHNTQTIPKLVGGIDQASGELATALYRQAIHKVIPVRSAEVAEAAKLLENVYRAVNIALVNELKIILTEMNVDVWEVIDAAATKPFGYQAFYPGPGLGGHCIPIDPFYLTWKAREVGHTTRFIELAGQINHQMPDYVIQRTMLALNDHGKAMKHARVLVLGVAYKPNVDDVRESPSFELIRQLRQLGAEVSYHDPHVPRTHPMRHYPDLPPMHSIDLTADMLSSTDCVLIATNHDACDWALVARHAQLIIDTRNAMQHVVNIQATVVKA